MILSGKDLRPQLIEELKNDPDLGKLTFFLYGRKDDVSCFYYLKGIKKSLDLLGIPYTEAFFDEALSKEENLAVFKEGCKKCFTILARPLHIDYEKEFVSLINPKFDPDMMSIENIGRLYSGDLDYLPATIQSCKYIIDAYHLDLEGKKALVLGRSMTVGKPIWQLLSCYNSFVAVAHSRISHELMNEYAKNSDYIFFATGKSGLIDRASLSKNSTIIDCGFSANGGDLGFVPEEDELKAYTPVPGGVGSLTSLCLVKNALTLFKKN